MEIHKRISWRRVGTVVVWGMALGLLAVKLLEEERSRRSGARAEPETDELTKVISQGIGGTQESPMAPPTHPKPVVRIPAPVAAPVYHVGRPDVPSNQRTSIPFCITPQALSVVLTTIGRKHPETGGKGFGPTGSFGVDTFEFDVRGSSHASGAVYAPDTEWSDARHDYWQDRPREERKLWVADLHSHPGGFGRPSGKSGVGLGDLGYVEEVFRDNEWMQYFFIPILTHTGPGREVTITPWLVARDNPHRPLLADLVVCDAADFPKRIFNPAWERTLTRQHSA